MSAPSVRERLTRLEEAGVIRGYRLDLDPAALGWPITAYVRIRPMPGQLAKIAELAASIPQVAECHRITGEDCFVLKVYLATIESMDGILDRFLAFGQMTTSLVQSSPVPLRRPPLSDPDRVRRKADPA
jgi:Lrp/AsnC family transcriptional regulator, leucine-responsive regulatory protein